MTTTITRRSLVTATAATAALLGTACTASNEQTAQTTEATMSLEQKISQMLMPALRSWANNDGGDNDFNVIDLGDAPKLAEALRRHQYGGVILFGQNIVDTEQTTKLVHDLQVNNAQSSDAEATGLIPYFVAADQEGGAVARLSMGTRGTGSMALGATGDAGQDNALATGKIFGQELSALGINVNLAPCLDVITNLADQGLSTRVYSDDPTVVESLGLAFAEGVGDSNVVTCFKHFPGAGDGSDYPTAIYLTLDELKQQGLIPYTAAIEQGAGMVMISATTFPAFDDEVVLADGKTKGLYPASMSPKIVGKMLREELGFQGVVMTDALEMDQFFEEPETGDKLLPGKKYSVECAVNIAQKCIEAGCDILLIPTDINSEDVVVWYDEYINGIAKLVRDGKLDEKRIDESVDRILALKEQYGVMDLDPTDDSLDDAVAAALDVVGSEDHHDTECGIAEQAVTLLKDDDVLPVPTQDTHVVIVGRTKDDANPIGHALSTLVEVGVLDTGTRIDNRLTGKVEGKKDSPTTITIDCYYDPADGGALVYSDELSAAIAEAQYVVCISAVSAGLEMLQDDDLRVQGVTRVLHDSHEAGAKFVLLSCGIPVDAARYPEADAIVCAYLPAGADIDPTTNNGAQNMRAINANVPVALRAIFGETGLPGKLPINVHALVQGDDGMWDYTDDILYARGSGA